MERSQYVPLIVLSPEEMKEKAAQFALLMDAIKFQIDRYLSTRELEGRSQTEANIDRGVVIYNDPYETSLISRRESLRRFGRRFIQFSHMGKYLGGRDFVSPEFPYADASITVGIHTDIKTREKVEALLVQSPHISRRLYTNYFFDHEGRHGSTFTLPSEVRDKRRPIVRSPYGFREIEGKLTSVDFELAGIAIQATQRRLSAFLGR